MFQSRSDPATTIRGKTADFTSVHLMIIDSLHKEVQPQNVTAEEAGCLQSAEPDITRKLTESSRKQG